MVAGAFYLRSLASWRTKKLFVGQARIAQLAFSSDGKTLLVGQDHLGKSAPRWLALDAAHGYGTKWSYKGRNNFSKPQFFLGDSRVLVREQYKVTLFPNSLPFYDSKCHRDPLCHSNPSLTSSNSTLLPPPWRTPASTVPFPQRSLQWRIA